MTEMYNTGVAYLLWFLSGFGAAGFHRFYLGKIGSGLLYLFTGGLFFVGGIADFFLIPSLVRDANLGLRYEQALRDTRSFDSPAKRSPELSLERTILETARANRGEVTPGQVALAGDFAIDAAQAALDKLASRSFCEMRIRESGTITYHFAEFADED